MKKILFTTIILFLGQPIIASEIDTTKTINRYIPLPKPHPTINNATLEGIDTNHNGVRDDVERKIYEKYPKKLHRALLMDAATIFQNIAISPTTKAKEIQKEVSRSIHCYIYLTDFDSEINSDNFDYIEFLEKYTFNTKERVRKYLDYNSALSGGNFASKPSDWNRNECSLEVIQVLEEMEL